jgi:ribosomal protein S18 acetylase RimI-like enzyme
MTALVPMSEAHFATFARVAVESYAHDNVVAGRWPAALAAAKSQEEFDRFLPQGLRTPGHLFYDILDEDGTNVGSMWFAIVGEGQERAGYLFNIRIDLPQRGRGHARAALQLLESQARELGLNGISLHVFGFNTPAQALYRSLGYGITGFNMRKPLVEAGD